MDAIVVKGLRRAFGELKAVNNVTFSVRRGEILGILGPNGAGKTTLISMISTLLQPSKGTITVNGHDVQEQAQAVRELIGYLFQESILDGELSGYDTLDIHARLYKIPQDRRAQRIKELSTLVGLSKFLDKKVSTYSGGMKRKLEFIRTLLHEPKILILDEPTLGLDPAIRRLLWTYIQNLNRTKKTTILLTTHYMEEADELCHRVGIMHRGKFVKIDTPTRLKQSLRGDVIEVGSSQDLEPVLSDVVKLRFVQDAELVDGVLRIYVTRAEKNFARILSLLHMKKIIISSITIKKPTLEDVFLHYTGEQLQ
ncbi:MAG TPA: ATP-binding cassette domain-containing protein [Candidatus Nanoarchaeia archaeon]|nr:ATP-binding cassette domain-containing protein [Candidatus Nanoarchaeia archaeon]